MPAPLSSDLRRRVLDAARTLTAPEAAARFGVSVATVHRLRRLDRLHGSLAPKPHAGGRALLIADEDRPVFDAYLAENPSMPHETMAHRFHAETGRLVSRPTVRRALARWRLTRKKSP
jgi:transposase